MPKTYYFSNSSKVLTLEEAADMLKVSHSTLYRAAQSGEVPAFKVRSQWRFSSAVIEALLMGAGKKRRP